METNSKLEFEEEVDEYVHLMRVNRTESFQEPLHAGFGYRLILIQEAAGLLQLGSHSYPITAPAFYCLNEKETVKIVACAALRAKLLSFHPGVVNDKFMMDELPSMEMLSVTEIQDLWSLEPFFGRNENYMGVIPLDPAVAKHAAQIMDEISDILELKPVNWPCRSRSYLFELLFLIRRIYQNSDTKLTVIPFSAFEQIEPVIVYLHTRYREKIKLEDLTERFHINKTTLNLQFKRTTGLSVIAYLNRFRMQLAGSMLRNTLLSTAEIMEMTGFIDDAHFIRSFRKYSGYSPSEYRSHYCWMIK